MSGWGAWRIGCQAANLTRRAGCQRCQPVPHAAFGRLAACRPSQPSWPTSKGRRKEHCGSRQKDRYEAPASKQINAETHEDRTGIEADTLKQAMNFAQ